MPKSISKELGIKYVFHDQFIPKKYLPTFSSTVIETFLHYIPGLSENFIYMNDDVYINRPMKKQTSLKIINQLQE